MSSDFRCTTSLVMGTRSRCGGDRGFVGGAEGLVFGILVFIVGAMLVANVWAVVDAKLAVSAAAREATRTFVEAPDAVRGQVLADEAARRVMDGHGRHGDRLELVLDPETRFERCARAGFTASYELQLVAVPFLGGLGRGATVTARHYELVDPYRSGVPGEAACG